MTKSIHHLYEFGSVTLDATNRLLYKSGKLLPVQPRVIETLLVLVENAHTVVDKERILRAVWPDVVVEEGGLKRNISVLRKALGEEGSFIETLPKRGYRFTAEVTERWEETPLPDAEQVRDEVVLERRASLRITSDEEISDSYDGLPQVSPPEKAIQATPLYQAYAGEPIRSLPRHRVHILAVSILTLVAAFGVLTAAGKLSVTRSTPPIKSLAVLPFKNAAAAGDDAHLGIGLADALITRLSSLKDLNVRPTSAIQKFDRKEQDAIAVGQALGVDAVLEGSIYRSGEGVRVTARLVRISDQSSVWAGQFDEKAEDFLSIQNTLSQLVADSLTLSLSPGEKNALAKRYTGSADAYQLYIEGRYHWNKRTYEGMVQAENLFRKAIEKDPNFALAYLGLADTLSMKSGPTESQDAIQMALDLDETLGEAYASRGFWNTFKAWRWEEAEADFRRAIELRPGSGTAHQWYATLLAITGRIEEAKAEMRQALAIDPTSHNFLADMGQMRYLAREYDEAESYCRKALEVSADFAFAHQYLTSIYIAKGDDERALEEMIKANIAFYPASTQIKAKKYVEPLQANKREIYRQSGLKGVLRANVEGNTKEKIESSSFTLKAYYYTVLGEREEALSMLEKGYEARDFLLPFVNIDPGFDALRAEPRFQDVLRKMKLAR